MKISDGEDIRLWTTAPETAARAAWPGGQTWQPGLLAKTAGTLRSSDPTQWRAALKARRVLQAQRFIARVERD